MPLGRSVRKNIAQLRRDNKKKPARKKRPMKQILAISYRAAGKSRRKRRTSKGR